MLHIFCVTLWIKHLVAVLDDSLISLVLFHYLAGSMQLLYLWWTCCHGFCPPVATAAVLPVYLSTPPHNAAAPHQFQTRRWAQHCHWLQEPTLSEQVQKHLNRQKQIWMVKPFFTMSHLSYSALNVCVPACLSGTSAGGDDPYKVTAVMLTAWTSAGSSTERWLGGTSCPSSLACRIL